MKQFQLPMIGLTVLALTACGTQPTGAPGPSGESSAQALTPAAPFRATGNEPSWRLDIGPSRLRWQSGSAIVEAPTPAPVIATGERRYTVGSGAGATVVAVSEDVCVDSMSGMPHPNAVEVLHEGKSFRGCGGDPATLLRGAPWQVEDIDGGGIIDRSRITLRFGADGQLSGQASCNAYTGAYRLTGETLSFRRPAATLRACAPALMQQEIRFLDSLGQVQRFEITPTGALVLAGPPGRSITARRERP